MQKALRNHLRISSATCSSVIDRMSKNGLVHRAENASDNRLNNILLTPQAVDKSPQIYTTLQKVECEIRHGFSDAELKEFFSILKRLEHNMENCWQ